MNTFFSIYSVFSVIFLSIGFSTKTDVIFPMWYFWLLPIFWPFVIPVVIVFYSTVMWLFTLFLKIDIPLKLLRKTIIRVTFFGFLCDLIVVGLICLVILGKGLINPTSDFYHWYDNTFIKAMNGNVFEDIFALLMMGLLIILSRIINYKLNKRYAFSRFDIEEDKKKKLAFSIAIFTAPYIFFIPLNWILK